MKRRNLTPQILAALRDTPVVYLQGPRQSGKSTLAQALREDGYEAEYFTLDDAERPGRICQWIAGAGREDGWLESK